jgi:3',5'-cyclic AMP phosphodiesterase CpdA
MNFQFASDLHLEFAQNKKLLSKKPILPVQETLIIAGDLMPLSAMDQHQDFLNFLSDHFKMTYWLPGNHEFYGSDLATMPNSFEKPVRSNVLLLNNMVKQIPDPAGPIELIFSTLWSHIPAHLTETVVKRVQDFNQIQWNGSPMTPKVYNQLHQDALEFLQNALQSKNARKLVISHHLPSFLNYPKKHQNDPINACFASNLDDFIQKTAPNAWIFGHHHTNIPPFLLGKTQLYTNQLGYVKFKEGTGFNRSASLIL